MGDAVGKRKSVAVRRHDAPKGGRDRSLDALRGIAILSVVLDHTMSKIVAPDHLVLARALVFVLCLYNVQLFGFTSGYLLKRVAFIHGVRTLLVPFIAGVLLSSAVIGGDLSASFPAQLAAAIGGAGMWFLWALFLSYCLFGLIRNRWMLLTVALFMGATWQLLPTWTFDSAVSFTHVLGAFRTLGLVLPYMVFGALWRRWEAGGLRLTGVVAGLSFAAFALVACGLLGMQYFVAVTTRNGAVIFTVAYWTIQTVGSCLGCVAFLWASRKLTGFSLGFLEFFGVISIGVYQFHPILITRFLPFFTTRSWPEFIVKTAGLVLASTVLTLLVGMNRVTAATFLGGRSWPVRSWGGSLKAVLSRV